MGCVTDTTTWFPLRISPLEDGLIASKHSVPSTLVVVQRSRSGDPVRDVRCDRRHLETQKYFVGVTRCDNVNYHCRACALTCKSLRDTCYINRCKSRREIDTAPLTKFYTKVYCFIL